MSKKNALIGFRTDEKCRDRIARAAALASQTLKFPVNSSDILRWCVEKGLPQVEAELKVRIELAGKSLT